MANFYIGTPKRSNIFVPKRTQILKGDTCSKPSFIGIYGSFRRVGIPVYLRMLLCMFCRRPSIRSTLRLEYQKSFVGNSLEIRWKFVGCLWQHILPHNFATKNLRGKFVELSLKFRCNMIWHTIFERKFNEISTIILVAKFCGKTNCHNPKISLKPR